MAAGVFLVGIVPFVTMSDRIPTSGDDPSPPGDRRPGRRGSESSGFSLAIEFLGYMGVMGYLGFRLDQRYGWDDRGLLGCLLLGLVAWIYRVLRQTRGLFK